MVVYKLTFINKGTRECPSHRTLDSASLSLLSLYSEFLGQAADGEPLTGQDIKPLYARDKNGKVILSFGKELAKRFKFITGPSSPLSRYLGYILPYDIDLPFMDSPGEVYLNSITPGFVYCSCVGNSIFNQHQSRLLAIVPLESKSNYSSYTFESPTYVTLATQSLRDVLFSICDKDGNLIKFEYMKGTSLEFPTILNLHLRPKV